MGPAMNSGERLAFDLPASADAVATARHRVVRAAAGRDDEADRDTLALLVSELVTNAVRHGGHARDLDVEVLFGGETVRVAVSDDGAGFAPRPRALELDQAGGWGLHFVAQLASTWGVSSGERTTVWFELPCSSHP